MLPDDDLGAAVARLPLVAVRGTLYRAVDSRYHASVNSVAGSDRASGRYHHKDDHLGTIYFAESVDLAAAEQRQERHSIFPPLPGQRQGAITTVVPFQVDLRGLIDLRDPGIRALLSTSLMELTGDWRLENEQGQRAETQRLARLVHDAGIEGLIYISATPQHGIDVVVFSHNLSIQMQASLPEGFPEQTVRFVGDGDA